MMHSFRHQRHDEREARLCFMAGPSFVPPSGPSSDPRSVIDRVSEQARAAAKWLIEKGTQFGADAVEAIGKFAADIPDAVLTGLEKAWATLPSKAEVMAYLSRFSSFFREMPQIFTYFPKAERLEDINTVLNLTDHTQWIAVFRANPDILEIPSAPIALPEGVLTPEDILLSLPPAERQAIYVQYVDTFIPVEVQQEMGATTDPRRTPEERYPELKGRRDLLNASLGGIIGDPKFDEKLTDAGDKAYATEMARKSIRSYYLMDDPSQSDYVSEGARSDYAQALQYQRLAGMPVTATDPARLMEKVGPSRFRGALLTGVLDRPQLDHIAEGLREREYEVRQSIASVRENLDYFTEATEAKNKKEAQGLRETWDRLGGIEKLVLLGVVTYGLWKSKGVRMIAAGAVGAYFFQKFVMKEDDPVKKWSQLMSGFGNKLKGANAELVGPENTPGYVEDVAGRSNVIVNFLDDFEMVQLERQAIGFGILHDMPMNTLARNFSMSGFDGQDMRLDFEDPTFNKQIGSALDKRGWDKRRYREFFEDPQSREQVTEAMSYVFFLNAAKTPENKPRVEMILETLRRCPPGTSLSIFGRVAKDVENSIEDPATRLQFQRAHEEYIRLVAEGREMAIGSGQTLGEFMSDNQNMNFVPQAVPGPEDDPRAGATPAPDVPSSGSSAPVVPPAGSAAPASPSSGIAAPASPASGTRPADAPPSGTSVPAAPASGTPSISVPGSGTPAVEAPASGTSVPEATTSGTAPFASPEHGMSVPAAPASGTASGAAPERGTSPARSPERGTSTPGSAVRGTPPAERPGSGTDTAPSAASGVPTPERAAGGTDSVTPAPRGTTGTASAETGTSSPAETDRGTGADTPGASGTATPER